MALAFLTIQAIAASDEGSAMKKKTAVLAAENELLVDLTLHNVSASLLGEFAQKIVATYYRGNMNAAIQDLIHRAIGEQDFVLSHITHIKNGET